MPIEEDETGEAIDLDRKDASRPGAEPIESGGSGEHTDEKNAGGVRVRRDLFTERAYAGRGEEGPQDGGT